MDPSGNICEKRANTLMDNVLAGEQLTRKEKRQLAAKLRDEARNGTISDKGRDVARQMGIDLGSVELYNNSADQRWQNTTETNKGDAETRTLYHYTNEKGMNAIVESQQLNPSLQANNPKDARHGDGQYLSDIEPNNQTPQSLAQKFIRRPNKYKYTHFVEIDVTGLEVEKGRESVFVIPNSSPLDLTGRIVSTGKVGTR